MRNIYFIIIMLIPLIVYCQTAIAPIGSGTVESPYQIGSLENLYWISINNNSWDKHFVQTANIDASPTANWFVSDHDNDPNTPDSAKGWIPIGYFIDQNEQNTFSGTYNGNNFSISNIYLNRFTSDNGSIGFISSAYNANLYNINILNITLKTNAYYVGGLIGYSEYSIIDNCSVSGVIKSLASESMIGGFIGYNGSYSIKNSQSNCTVYGNQYIGGFVGQNFGYLINFCNSNSNVNVLSNDSFSLCGGFVGENCGIIKNSFSQGTVRGNTMTGGFVGIGDAIQSCYSNCTVYSNDYCGGFSGFSYNLENCYSTGDVYRLSGGSTNFGNFSAEIGSSAKNCYATGSVYWQIAPHPTNLGFTGVFHYGSPPPFIHFFGNIWNTETSGQSTSNSGDYDSYSLSGLNTLQMQDVNYFLERGWNFDGVWSINTQINNGFPILRLIDLPIVTILNPQNISDHSVTLSANLLTNGLSVLEYGFCLSISQYPTVNNSIIVSEPYENDNYSISISSLTPNTTYYVRAFLQIANATSYSDQISFTTHPIPPFIGTGTVNDPYIINSYENLEYLTQHSQFWDKHFLQTADIDANGQTSFTPIGNSNTPFSGSYNGNNHTINNLTINTPMQNNVALFGVTQNSLIKDLGVVNIWVRGMNYVAGFIGKNNGLIKNCYVSGDVNAVSNYNEFGQDQYAYTINFGGFVASNFTQGFIENCYSTCDVSGKDITGGFVGSNFGTIFNSYCTGNVNAGQNYSYYRYAGFIGQVEYQSVIEKCYSNSRVFDSTNLGFVCSFAFAYDCFHLNDNFWNINTSLQNTTGGAPGEYATGLMNSQMLTQSYFIDKGWDFDNDWTMEGGTYPHLLNKNLPSIISHIPDYISSSTTKLIGRFRDLENEAIIRYGFCLSRNKYPTLSDTLIILQSNPQVGEFNYLISGLITNDTYYYRAFAENSNGIAYGNDIEFKANVVQGNDPNQEVSKPNIITYAAYPNPFNPRTTISFELDKGQDVELSIFDIKGKKVKSIVHGYQSAGYHKYEWDGSDQQNNNCSSGVYFYRLLGSNFVKTHKMILLK